MFRPNEVLCQLLTKLTKQQLTKTFVPKRPAIKYLSTVVYCSWSEILLPVSTWVWASTAWSVVMLSNSHDRRNVIHYNSIVSQPWRCSWGTGKCSSALSLMQLSGGPWSSCNGVLGSLHSCCCAYVHGSDTLLVHNIGRGLFHYYSIVLFIMEVLE